MHTAQGSVHCYWLGAQCIRLRHPALHRHRYVHSKVRVCSPFGVASAVTVAGARSHSSPCTILANLASMDALKGGSPDRQPRDPPKRGSHACGGERRVSHSARGFAEGKPCRQPLAAATTGDWANAFMRRRSLGEMLERGTVDAGPRMPWAPPWLVNGC